jgi:hypothetical protein
MKNTRCILMAALSLLLVVDLTIPLQPVWAASPDYSSWNDLGIVYTPPSGTLYCPGAAYYPSVLYDAGGFGGGSPLYKMWYSDGSGGVCVVTSTDGITWGSPVLADSGLSGSPNHVQVLYDPNCFGAASCGTTAAKYHIWYEDTANLYSISALATGSSRDGVNWTDSGPVAQSSSSPLVTTVGWSLGTYGPIHLTYQVSATNKGKDPWNYSYVMYYDGTTGAVEATGLAYSGDGLTWTAASISPVLDIGAPGAWDANYATFGTVLKTGTLWSYWYSGGVSSSHEGIGYASSSDGQSWSKAASNPIFSVSQGVSYRNQRVYTPSVLDDGNGNLRMYYSAVGTDGIKKIGLAVLAPTTAFVDASWTGLAVGTPVTFPGDPTTHTIGIDAFDKIQEGINAVLNSGTVKVAPSTYKENITISKPLTLQSSSGPSSTFIDASITGNPYVVFISSKNVTLVGFDISSPGYTGSSDASGVVVEPSPYATGANVRITNNIIHDIGSHTRTSVSYGTVGVNIGFVDGVEVDHNQIYNIIHADPTAWANGISIWGNGPSTPSNDISIHDNSFHDISSPYPADADISTQTDVGMNVVVFNNNIISTTVHPTEFGVQVLSSNIVDARHNWWGDPGGPSGVAPGHGSAITVNVLYDPWLTPAFSAKEVFWNYGWVKVATTSAGKVFTIQNTGSASLVIGTVTIAGTNATQFHMTADTCSGHTLNPWGTCTITATFRPTAAGAKSAHIIIPDNAAGHPHTLQLLGTGGIELVVNGGFDTYPTPTSKIPTYWFAYNFAATHGKDTLNKKEGTASVKIANTSVLTKTLTQTRMISGKAGNTFLLSLWGKGESIPPTAGLVRAQVLLYHGATLKQTAPITFYTGTYGFLPRTLAFTATSSYNKIVIQLVYSKATGAAWFDGLSLLRSP